MQKILFAGPVGAGKSSAIASVSDSGVVHTDVGATDQVAELKARTTVAMDYGTLKIDESLTIQLVGTPGQQRFSFMWDILSNGAVGVVLLLDNSRPDPIDDLAVYLRAFGGLIQQQGGAGVVGVTHIDCSSTPSLAQVHRCIVQMGYQLPVFEVDARQREDVKILLLALASELNPSTYRRRVAAR